MSRGGGLTYAMVEPSYPSVKSRYTDSEGAFILAIVLRCEECGRESHGRCRRWRAYLNDDGEVAVFCPACAVREFGLRRHRRF